MLIHGSAFSTVSSEPSVFVSAAQWVQGALLGSVATAIAVIAVGAVGLLMLTGRLNIRRGAMVILGCFILFGAASIANGLRGVAVSTSGHSIRSDLPINSRAGIDPSLLASDTPSASSDPYAGASIRR